MLQIDVATDAQKFLKTLPEKYERQIVGKILLLAKNPNLSKSKQLEGYAPLRKLRSGDYRIIYFVDRDTLKIPLIGKRGDDDVYRRLKRLFG